MGFWLTAYVVFLVFVFSIIAVFLVLIFRAQRHWDDSEIL